MATCEVCGNDYWMAFEVRTVSGDVHTFDSFECAIHRMAPICEHCQIKIVGHGVEVERPVLLLRALRPRGRGRRGRRDPRRRRRPPRLTGSAGRPRAHRPAYHRYVPQQTTEVRTAPASPT